MHRAQYENRLTEVLEQDTSSIRNKEQATSFKDILVQFVEFIETTPHYEKLIEQIFGNKRIRKLEVGLVDKGNLILQESKRLLEKIDNAIEEQNIELPSEASIWGKYPAGTVITFTVMESLANQVHRTHSNVSDDAQVGFSEISNIVQNLGYINWDLVSLNFKEALSKEELDAIEALRVDFESTRSEYERLKKHYGSTGYVYIKGVWEHETKSEMTTGSMEFGFSPLGAFIRDDHGSRYTLEQVQSDAKRYQGLVKALSRRIKEIEISNDFTLFARLKNVTLSILKRLIGTTATEIWSRVITLAIASFLTALFAYLHARRLL